MDLLLDLDDELIVRLERMAKINGLALEEQLKRILTDSANGDDASTANANSGPRAD